MTSTIGESKYPLYWSESKKVHLRLEDMPDPHLMNAWRKLGGTERQPETKELQDALTERLHERGYAYDNETNRWGIWPECSMCRVRHPFDDRHACE